MGYVPSGIVKMMVVVARDRMMMVQYHVAFEEKR